MTKRCVLGAVMVLLREPPRRWTFFCGILERLEGCGPILVRESQPWQRSRRGFGFWDFQHLYRLGKSKTVKETWID